MPFYVISPRQQPTILQVCFNDQVFVFNGTRYGTFAGTNELSTNGPYSQKTFEIKFNPSNGVTNRQVLYEQGGSNAAADAGNGFSIYIEGGNLYGGVWSNTASPEYNTFISTPITANSRYYCAMVYNVPSVSLLLVKHNDIAPTSFDDTDVVGDMPTHGNPAAIGSINESTRFHDGGEDGVTGTRVFDGNIDEIRLWNKVFSLNYLLSNINTIYTGSETDLIGFFKFDEGSGGTMDDSSTSADDHTATISGGGSWTSAPACT